MNGHLKDIRIVFLVPELRRSGPIHFVLSLTKHLKGLEQAPEVIAISSEQREPLDADFHTCGIGTRVLGLSRLRSFAALGALESFCTDERPAILHTTGLRPDLLALRVRSRHPSIRIVSTVQSILDQDLRMAYGRIAGKVVSRVWTNSIKRFDCVVAFSDGIRNSLESFGVESKRIRVIYNGVDVDEFRISSDEGREATRGRLGIGGKDVVVGHVGDLIARKGVDLILQALKEMSTPWRVVFLSVGTGPEHQRLTAMAHDFGLAGRVIWAGRQTDVRAYLAAMDVFCLPSWTEGMARALVEACAVGLPAIATRVSGSCEIVVHGETGYIIDPGDVRGLATGLESLAASRERRWAMGLLARKRVESHFSARAMAEQYLALYQELLLAQSMPEP